MGVAGEAELDAQCRGPWKRIGVVREQDVRDVGPDKSCEATEHGGGFARTGAFALVVDANQIEAPQIFPSRGLRPRVHVFVGTKIWVAGSSPAMGLRVCARAPEISAAWAP